ncbi:sigma-70 family RNA polymerase sigma factor [Lentilactobacillus sp. Marseille-Q4993]|uniref:sigma-70 family RNA polymerase sigma factor n=1 Tax=Lentilactobacillus sp. Marseille-Q4993 TaxID=3039492 RepID=UPI0024BD029B|nr:sigma-70 family RNA polymerase sigma factor [Lentilactobacillus sp. Marseille-Q4993]
MNHENNRSSYQEAFEFMQAGDHEVVIFGVLRRLHISPNHEYYDDMVQEGRMAFAEAYLKCGDEDDTKRKLVFIYQKVYWTMLNYLKKQLRINGHRYEADDTNEDPLLDIPAMNDDPDLDCKLQYEELMNQCTDKERQYLLAAYKYGMNFAEIAREYGVSRKTVYKWRDGLLKKAREISN